jgi:chromosome segregation ATPase
MALGHYRHTSLHKEIESYNQSEESLKRNYKKLETEKSKEEEKLAEAQKALESSPKDNKKGTIKSQPVKVATTNKNKMIDMNDPLHYLTEELKQTENKINILQGNREKTVQKQYMLTTYLEKFEPLNKFNIKIELVDGNGDRVGINTKGDMNANLYLLDKQCYELHRLFNSKFFCNIFNIIRFFK